MRRAVPALLLAACSAAPTPQQTSSPTVVARLTPTPSVEALRCEKLTSTVTCPDGTLRNVYLGPLSEEGSLFCKVHCLDQATPNGPYLLSHVSSEQKETRGFYKNGKQTGKWTVWGTHPESLERIQL